MLEISAILAILAAFVILLITRLGIVEKIQQKGSKLISELFQCRFCLSFWTIVVIYLFSLPFFDIHPLCILLATPLTRSLI